MSDFTWRLLFWLKRYCDQRLYGAVQVPSKYCRGCGKPYGAQPVAPPFHAACLAPGA